MDSSPQIPLSTSDLAVPPETERRNQADRRERPTSPWDTFSAAGLRMRLRRSHEHRRPYFVDRFPPALLAFILLLLLGTIVDAILTLHLLQAGAEEINPVMSCLLDYGILPFFLGKYLLTVVGLPLLLVFQNHYLFGSRFRVGYLIPATVTLYLLLIGYQVVLVYQHVPRLLD